MNAETKSESTEIASKKREEQIEELTNRLLENEFYPFSYRHFYGALAQMPDDLISRYIVDLAAHYDSDPFGAQYAQKLGVEIVREVKAFWREAAREEAEKTDATTGSFCENGDRK